MAREIKKFNVGELDKPVTLIFKRNETSESGSVYTVDDVSIGGWAKLTWLKGSELAADKTSISKQKVVFTVRYIPGFNALTRIEYRGDRYDVEDIREKGRDHLMQIGCVKNT